MAILDTDRRVFVLAFARMADAIGNSFLIVVLPLYVASGYVTGNAFGLGTAVVTGFILSAFGFFMSFIQPFAGILSDRTGKRKAFIVVGLLVLTVANFAYTYAGSYALMLVFRILQGIGVAITIPATLALVNNLSDQNTRGGSMGVFSAFRMLGFGVGPVVAGTVIHGGPYTPFGLTFTGFQAAFYIASLGSLIGAFLVWAFVSDPEIDPDDEETPNAGNDYGIAVRARDEGGVLDSVFTLGLASLFMAIGIALIAPLETQVNQHLGQGATVYGLEFAAFTLGQFVTQSEVGAWSDEYGRKPFILLGLVVLIPATFAEGLVGTPLGMATARFVQGIAGAMVFAPAFALAGDLAQRSTAGTTLSILTMAFGLGVAIGPLVSGWLVGFGYVVPFGFGAILAALGAVLVYIEVEETHSGKNITSSLFGSPSQSAD